MHTILMNSLLVDFAEEDQQEFNRANSKLFTVAFWSLVAAFYSHRLLSPVFSSEEATAATPPWVIYTVFSLECVSIGVFIAACVKLKKAANKVIEQKMVALKLHDDEYMKMRARFFNSTNRFFKGLPQESSDSEADQTDAATPVPKV